MIVNEEEKVNGSSDVQKEKIDGLDKPIKQTDFKPYSNNTTPPDKEVEADTTINI